MSYNKQYQIVITKLIAVLVIFSTTISLSILTYGQTPAPIERQSISFFVPYFSIDKNKFNNPSDAYKYYKLDPQNPDATPVEKTAQYYNTNSKILENITDETQQQCSLAALIVSTSTNSFDHVLADYIEKNISFSSTQQNLMSFINNSSLKNNIIDSLKDNCVGTTISCYSNCLNLDNTEVTSCADSNNSDINSYLGCINNISNNGVSPESEITRCDTTKQCIANHNSCLSKNDSITELVDNNPSYENGNSIQELFPLRYKLFTLALDIILSNRVIMACDYWPNILTVENMMFLIDNNLNNLNQLLYLNPDDIFTDTFAQINIQEVLAGTQNTGTVSSSLLITKLIAEDIQKKYQLDNIKDAYPHVKKFSTLLKTILSPIVAMVGTEDPESGTDVNVVKLIFSLIKQAPEGVCNSCSLKTTAYGTKYWDINFDLNIDSLFAKLDNCDDIDNENTVEKNKCITKNNYLMGKWNKDGSLSNGWVDCSKSQGTDLEILICKLNNYAQSNAIFLDTTNINNSGTNETNVTYTHAQTEILNYFAPVLFGDSANDILTLIPTAAYYNNNIQRMANLAKSPLDITDDKDKISVLALATTPIHTYSQNHVTGYKEYIENEINNITCSGTDLAPLTEGSDEIGCDARKVSLTNLQDYHYLIGSEYKKIFASIENNDNTINFNNLDYFDNSNFCLLSGVIRYPGNRASEIDKKLNPSASNSNPDNPNNNQSKMSIENSFGLCGYFNLDNLSGAHLTTMSYSALEQDITQLIEIFKNNTYLQAEKLTTDNPNIYAYGPLLSSFGDNSFSPEEMLANYYNISGLVLADIRNGYVNNLLRYSGLKIGNKDSFATRDDGLEYKDHQQYLFHPVTHNLLEIVENEDNFSLYHDGILAKDSTDNALILEKSTSNFNSNITAFIGCREIVNNQDFQEPTQEIKLAQDASSYDFECIKLNINSTNNTCSDVSKISAADYFCNRFTSENCNSISSSSSSGDISFDSITNMGATCPSVSIKQYSNSSFNLSSTDITIDSIEKAKKYFPINNLYHTTFISSSAINSKPAEAE